MANANPKPRNTIHGAVSRPAIIRTSYWKWLHNFPICMKFIKGDVLSVKTVTATMRNLSTVTWEAEGSRSNGAHGISDQEHTDGFTFSSLNTISNLLDQELTQVWVVTNKRGFMALLTTARHLSFDLITGNTTGIKPVVLRNPNTSGYTLWQSMSAHARYDWITPIPSNHRMLCTTADRFRASLTLGRQLWAPGVCD